MTRLLMVLGLFAGPVLAQDEASAPPAAVPVLAQADAGPPPLAATPTYAADRWLTAREPVTIELNSSPEPAAGRLAVFLGRTDVTALTERTGATLIYRPGHLRTPTGETEVAIYLVSGEGEWRELGRFPIRILNRAGFQELGLVPKLDLVSDGQLDQGQTPPPPTSSRGTYQDITLNVGFQGAATRPGWILRSQANAVGVSRDEQRLRFGERGLDAPAVDLADYLVQLERGPVQASLGHVTFGSNRHLINGHGSRGASGLVRLGSVATLGLAALNGSSIVGWSNPIGLSRPDHRLLSAELGLELVPTRPGLVRLAATVLDGSVLPVAGYTQGVVNDAEEGRGAGIQMSLSDPSQRVRVGGGFTRASFTNPDDSLLAQGAIQVPVRSTTRNARYLDASVQLVRAAMLSPTVQATLTGGFRHERVDPLYRSVASQSRADWKQDVFEATGTLGQLGVQYAHTRSRDNLADIPSILTTRTRDHALGATLPAGAVFRAPPTAWWWPVLAANYQVTHQAGDGVPENGGFSPSHVPDQLNRNATLSASWQQARWNLGYRHNVSRQDNRQPGRENADFRAWVHAVTLGFTPLASLGLALDLASERQRSIEADRLQRIRRVGLQADWRLLTNTTLLGYASLTDSDDEPLTQESEATELRLEASQGFNLYRRTASGTQARVFLRYGRSTFSPDQTLWSLATGLSLRLY
ncbi:MAG TPA: hypothetical protein VMN37_03625 [Gemmatimonadales bacterium]|nr:hypothetical protein [Gemmatimonadales bacterium]